jgi:AraC-like DNA-binding protein
VQRPGEIQQVAHPAGGDVCTSMTISPELAGRIGASGQFRVSPVVDLAHRQLVSRAVGGADAVELADRAAEVAGAVLAEPVPVPRPGLIEDARALLGARPALPLTRLAAELGVSAWYLSRTFHRATGITLSRYRRRLRARAALEQFVVGATTGTVGTSLADLAAQLGFADQAHLCRALQAENGRTPTALRALLSPPRPAGPARRPRDCDKPTSPHDRESARLPRCRTPRRSPCPR